MSQQIRISIDKTFGFEAVCINSALVSAQNRQRLYWVGVRNADGTYRRAEVAQPEDKGILLKDVLDGITDREKARTVMSSAGRTTTREYFSHSQGNMKFIPVNTTVDGKAQTIRATCYKDGIRNFEQYTPGVISRAKDEEKKLTFVDEEHIGICILYGDILTRLNFDLNDKDFQAIENCEVKRIGNFFEEYECEKLLPAENYSLEELSTLKMIIEMTKRHDNFVRMCATCTCKGELWQVLKSYGFNHSSNVMRQIRSALDKNPYFTQEEALELIDNYIKQNYKCEFYVKE